MTITDWQRVAREFGDHDLEYDRFGPSMTPINDQHTVGDWLPSEPTAKEILRLRKRVEVLERVHRAANDAVNGVGDPRWQYPLVLALQDAAKSADNSAGGA